jgi:phosphatidylglycerol lysyltransferase
MSMADLVPRTRYADWFLDSFHVVGGLSLLLAIYSLARPVVWRRNVHPRELAAARALIEQYGTSPLDFFKFGADKLIFFSSTRRGLVSFRVANSVALALGDPVARDREEFCRVLREFMQFCADNDWRVAFHQVPATALCDYAEAGLKSLKIGEEAMVNVQSFTLEGRPMKTLRSGVRKIGNLGYDTRIHQPPIPAHVMDQLKAVSEDWLALPGRRERGFTLGQFDEHYLTACPIMTVEDKDGEIWAFANFIPDYAPGETTIDLMRYRRDAPNGLMDFLFVRLFEYTRAEGYQRFALGLAPFAEVGSAADAPTREKALRLLMERLSFVFSYKGLWAYKEKFHPDWEPRYLIYESELALPATTVAIIRITEG